MLVDAYLHSDVTCFKWPNDSSTTSLFWQGIDWSPFGFSGRGAEQSTLWLGTAGAHTLCHRDTYGLNLVTQLVGRSANTDGLRSFVLILLHDEKKYLATNCNISF